jgi:hypothetical protein
MMPKANFTMATLLFLSVVIACANVGPPRRDVNGRSVQSNSSPPKPGENWIYGEHDDPMSGGTVKTASTTSLNTLSFDFPYQGEQSATLTLRRHPRYGKDITLSIERGQFLGGTYGPPLMVRFDENKPQAFRALEPEDHSTTIVFISGYDKFVSALRHSKLLRIQASFYHQGSPVMEFNVESLKENTP